MKPSETKAYYIKSMYLRFVWDKGKRKTQDGPECKSSYTKCFSKFQMLLMIKLNYMVFQKSKNYSFVDLKVLAN